MGRHAKPRAPSANAPVVVAAVLVPAWAGLVAFIDSVGSLRLVAAVAGILSVVLLVLLARAEARYQQLLTKRAVESRYASTRYATAAAAAEAELRRVHDELDLLTAEVARLRREMNAVTEAAIVAMVTPTSVARPRALAAVKPGA
ncbi:MAG: hypothetical protein ABWZ26_07015 [Candidatus Nanopelagicales bacterium]